MVASQNGWVANDPSVLDPHATAVGTAVQFPRGVRKDAPGQLLMAVAGRFHREVERLVPGTCWGYSERQIRGGGDLSNHASGTAIDCNAPQHPEHVRGTFSRKQVAAIHRIIADTGHVVRWGGDYVGDDVDEMHFEINNGQTMADCERALAALRPKEDDMQLDDVVGTWRDYNGHDIHVKAGDALLSAWRAGLGIPGKRTDGDLGRMVRNIAHGVDMLIGTVKANQAALLAAIDSADVPTVDADALIKAGLPQEIVTALLATLSNAAGGGK